MFELPNEVRLIRVATLKRDVRPAQELIVLHLQEYFVESQNSLIVFRCYANKLLELRDQMLLCARVTTNDFIEF